MKSCFIMRWRPCYIQYSDVKYNSIINFNQNTNIPIQLDVNVYKINVPLSR